MLHVSDGTFTNDEGWIEATLRSLPELEWYPADKVKARVEQSGGNITVVLHLPVQLSASERQRVCRWAARAAAATRSGGGENRPVEVMVE